MSLEFSARIARIPSYPVAGGYAAEAPPVRLASNESPFPPLAPVREAVERELETLNRYPDPSNSLLRKRLSERYEVPAPRIAIGNGSCDILLAAGEALLEPGALPRVIRVLIHYYAPEDHSATHVYLGEASELRTDLSAAQ